MASVERRPRIPVDRVEAWLEDRYGIRGTATPLPGERDANFAVRAEDGRSFVFKVANPGERIEWLRFECEVMARLSQIEASDGGPAFPGVVAAIDGEILGGLPHDGDVLATRLLTFVEGVPLARFRPHDRVLLGALGRRLAGLDLALIEIDDAEAHREFRWDLARADRCFAAIDRWFVGDRLAILRSCEALWRESEPVRAGLPRQLVHGDANDHNVMVRPGTAAPEVGLIDFGDMLHSYTVGEIAIAAAYAMLDKRDPLGAAVSLVEGYHSVSPLSEPECEALFPLICTRLAQSATFAAEQMAAAPGNEYLSISQRAVWDLLETLHATCPRLWHYAFRAACGFDPHPSSRAVRGWLRQHAHTAASLLAPDLATDTCHVLDLSVGSAELPTGFDPHDADAFTDLVFGAMDRAGARIGVGRYDEARLVYASDTFAVPSDDGSVERRTVHLGIDLFAFAGTPVHAPFDGVVHSVGRNDTPLDYGPTVILRHETDEGDAFYTLYGHLSAESVVDLAPGVAVARGARFARIGAPPDNGGWPPHVHFQVVMDMLDRIGDFPGVACPRERELWTGLCPNPAEILRLPRAEVTAPRADAELGDRRRQALGPSLGLSYRRPLHMVRGEGTRLFDVDGRSFLDCVNNVCHVGHCHPRVVAAAARQMALLNTNTRYLHDHVVKLAGRLTAKLPEPLRVCFFVNSGSEAGELALRMARAATGRRDVVVVDGAYHGNTSAMVDLSPYKHDGPGGSGAPGWVHAVPMPDRYRGRHRDGDGELGARYAEYVARVVAEHPPAAFFCESILSCGGQIVLPDGYLDRAYEAVRAAGGVCVADEVQVGMGRVGSHFSAFETQGVVPDIVTFGKPFGNGHPLAAVVTTEAIATAFANGMEYFNTFGGNPVSCAVGLAVLDVIDDEELQNNAATVGGHLLAGLRELGERHAAIGDVRGLGLFLGVEFVGDREARTPDAAVASYVAERARDFGVLLSTDGPDHNVIKIKPPMVFSLGDADRVVAVVDEILGETAVADR